LTVFITYLCSRYSKPVIAGWRRKQAWEDLFACSRSLGFGSSGGDAHDAIDQVSHGGRGGGPCWPRPDSSRCRQDCPGAGWARRFSCAFWRRDCLFSWLRHAEHFRFMSCPCMGVEGGIFCGEKPLNCMVSVESSSENVLTVMVAVPEIAPFDAELITI